MRPFEALRAMRRLLADPEATEEVFVIIRALAGWRSYERLFRRVLADPAGRRVLERESGLLELLGDQEGLRAMPEGCLGRAYADFIVTEQITPDGLVAASEANEVDYIDPRAERLGLRLRDTHDLWHVMTGYGRDLVGEAALLAFTYAQTRNLGIAFIVVMALLRGRAEGVRGLAALYWKAYRRGCRAGLLAAVDWEAELSRPLDDLRTELLVGAPATYDALRTAEMPAA